MLHALTSARLEFIVDDTSGSLEVVHLGSPVGHVDPTSFSAPTPEGGIDHLAPIAVLAEAAAGWMGKPGLRLHRNGTVVFPRLDSATVTSDGSSLRAVACDPATQVTVTILATLHDAGVLELVVELRNDGAPLTVDEVLVSVPVPQASEVLQFGGRWSDEFHPTRHSWEWGTFVVENRSGRTSATRFPMLMAGTADFSEQSGTVTAIHLGWSGDGQVRADRLPDGRRILQAGEIFGAGEVVLDTGETHRSAPVFLAHSAAGLNGISDSFHGYVRARRPMSPPSGRSSSTPGRPCTSLTTSTPSPRLPIGPPPSVSSVSCSTTAGSSAATTTGGRSATGSSIRRSGPPASTRSSPMCEASGWSSACGSNRR